jgi:hypothetical protein
VIPSLVTVALVDGARVNVPAFQYMTDGNVYHVLTGSVLTWQGFLHEFDMARIAMGMPVSMGV